jgi:gamma-glutamyl-gamma-aminobutyraldehyde dehydrogenase
MQALGNTKITPLAVWSEGQADSLEGVLANITKVFRPSQAIIDGHWVDALDSQRFERLSPRDGSIVSSFPALKAEDIDLAVKSARRAFDQGVWRLMPPRQKKAVFLKWQELLRAHAEPLALLETMDTGKPIRDSRSVDIPLSIQSVGYYGEAIDKIYGEVAPSPHNRLSYCEHEPLGVVGAIVPWNFPLHMALWKVAPCLAMGNSILLKPAENSSMTALYAAALAHEAGLPAGVLNVVTGLGSEAGDAMARHMDIDMIAFTGSGRVGRMLMVASGQSNLKRVSLELGGKSPQIVFDDADLDEAALAAAWGVFYNQGQVCTAASRLFVHASIKDQFLPKVLDVARSIKVGDPYDPLTQFGSMISPSQMHTVLGYIKMAKDDGAHCLMGGGALSVIEGGSYLSPTIFDGVQRHHKIASEEIFGPVLAVMGFEDEAEVIRLGNDTVYGLAAGLWTRDLGRAMRVSRALKAGMVWVNGWDACDISSPFGGFKQSGFGRDRSLHALYKYADLKSTSFSF